MSYIIQYKKRDIKIINITIRLILLILLLSLVIGCDKPRVAREEFDEIDVSQEPSQIQISTEPIVRKMKDGEYTITPLANYKVSAVVVSKKSYSGGWSAEVAPVDLALVWGKLADPEYDKYITYSQSDRWYFYVYKEGSPFNNYYVITHSGNNHIIPADENIYKAIKTIKKKQKVRLEGLLVNVSGRYRGEHFWWNSSVTRTDSGDGSCELFYVEKIRIGNKVYE